jgi:hypothetical protein
MKTLLLLVLSVCCFQFTPGQNCAASISADGPTTFCQGGSVILSANTTSDSWTQKANFGGIARANAVSFSIGNKGYIGIGKSLSFPFVTHNDFWSMTP